MQVSPAAAGGSPPNHSGRATGIPVALSGAARRHAASRCGADASLLQKLLLARLHLFAERLQFVLGHQLPGTRKHLAFLFLDVMLHQLLEDLRAATELLGSDRRLVQVRQYQFPDRAMLFARLEEHFRVIALFAGLLERRIEDLVLDLRMDLELLGDLRKQLGALLFCTRRRSGETLEEFLHLVV